MNPGCYAMDYLSPTGCYKRKVRLFKDDPRTFTMRWYVLPECSPAFPTHHLFASSVWGCVHPLPSPNPGELEESPKVWDRGLPPPAPNPFRGRLEWYEEGAPISAFSP